MTHSLSPSEQITFKDPDFSDFSTLIRKVFFPKGLGNGPGRVKKIEEQTECTT